MTELLLHSLDEFEAIVLEVMAALAPREVVGIGLQRGSLLNQLKELMGARNAQLHIIEPYPEADLLSDASESDWLHLHVGLSLDVLSELRLPGEVQIIAGDHNYFTVRNELELIHSIWRDRGMCGAMLLHHVGWPCGRRDQYHNPLAIPQDALHPHRYDRGVQLDNNGMVAGGFRGEGAFAYAEKSGGPNNGVLTAVEDFIQAHPGYVYRSIDAIFGLGAITVKDTTADKVVEAAFLPYQMNLLSRMERNRLELYLKVLELQDQLIAEQRAHAALRHRHEPCLNQKDERPLPQHASRVHHLAATANNGANRATSTSTAKTG